MLSNERVVCVWCPETKQVGSGYRVSTRWVITARHVVDGAQGCRVRLHGEREYRPTQVSWPGRGNVDIALIDLGEGLDELEDGDPHWAGCRWVDGECVAVGYPQFLADDDGPEREQFVGRLRPLAGIERGHVHAAGTWAGPRAPEQWRGMSGAGLFSQGYLLGVVTEAMSDRLIACPVSRLFEDDEFGAAFPDFVLDDAVLWPEADRPAVRQLRPWGRRTPTRDRPPSELLLAHNEVVPFDDSLRVRELALLKEFSEARGPKAKMLVLTGEGGAGKTRLMIEWCARMRERGWLAGFVESGHPDVARVTEGETPRLLVVDYPDGRVGELVALCRCMQAAATSVRLVVLARSRGLWFDELRQEVSSDLVARALWHELEALDDKQRRRTYVKARAIFGRVAEHEIVVNEDDLVPDDPPLVAHMRALLREHGDEPHDEKPEQVLARVLAHERKHWRKQLVPLVDSPASKGWDWDLDRVVGALVLFGGTDQPLGRVIAWLLPELDRGRREILAACVEGLYSRGGRTMPLQPDLLGEQLVFEAMTHATKDGDEGLRWWLRLPVAERAPPGSVGRFLVVLTRLVERGGAAREWLRMSLTAGCVVWMKQCVRLRDTADPRGHELAGAVRALGDVGVAKQLETELPQYTVELLLLRVEVIRVLLEHTAFDESQQSQGERARLLMNLGVYLSDAGQREAALAKAQEAVDILRKLVSASPDAFFLPLALTLITYGKCLSDLGRQAEAIAVAEEAVSLYEKLVQENSAYLPELAVALSNLGGILCLWGRQVEAVAPMRKSVSYYERLVDTGTVALLPELAMSLNNLGTILSSLGHAQEAASTTWAAVEYYRKLAEECPDRFLPDLAGALNNLGNRLREISRPEEAMAASYSSLEYYRALVVVNPSAFRSDLAMALANLGSVLSPLGKQDEAVLLLQESVDHYRKLSEETPDAFLLTLAKALNNLGGCLSNSGRNEQAMKTTQEAVAICRNLVDGDRDAVLPEMAKALTNLALDLNSLGRREKAVYVMQEAVSCYRDLADASPGVFLPDLASSLAALSFVQREIGAYEMSRDSLMEGMEILLPFYHRRPYDYERSLADLAADLQDLYKLGELPIPEDLREWVERESSSESDDEQ